MRHHGPKHADWFRGHTYDVIAEVLNAGEIPFSKTFSIADIVADPHFTARSAIVRLEDPDLGSVPAPGVVPRFSGIDWTPPRSGPALGEYNSDFYRESGMSEASLAALRADNVI